MPDLLDIPLAGRLAAWPRLLPRGAEVREEPGRLLRFLIVARRQPTESQLANLSRSVEQGVGSDFRPVLDFVDDIPAAPTGKWQDVVPLAPGLRPEDARKAS